MTITTATTTAMTRTLPRRIASAAMTLALVVAAVAFWPAHLGGSTRMVLVSGTSMEPTYLLGDVVVVRSNDTPEVGDVVVFAIPEGTGAGMLVIHRIVGTDDDGFFVTQGDNRDTVDQWPLTTDDIVGTPILRLPYAGRIAMALGRWPVSSVGLGLIATMVLWPRRRHDEAFEEQTDGTPTDGPAVTSEPTDQGRAGAGAGVVGEPVDDDLWQELDALLGLAAPATDGDAEPDLMADAMAWLEEQLQDTGEDRGSDPDDRELDHIDAEDRDPDDTEPMDRPSLPRREPRQRSATTAATSASSMMRSAWERLAERPLDELRFG